MDKYPHYTIGELCNIEKGLTGIASATPGDYPLVNTSAERKSCNTYQFDTEAVCIPLVSSTGHGKKSLNYVHYQKGKFALGTILAAVIPKDPKKLSAAFLHRYLQFNKDRKIVPLMKGAANVSLAVKDIAKIEIPVPPIEEQTSFIELFNNLNDSSTKLQSEFLNQSSFLSLLRQTILQEAIEGKLTETWRKINPVRKGDPEYDANALLEKIKSEKQKMIADGKIRKEKPLVTIKPEDIPFELPDGWVLTRLGEVTHFQNGYSFDSHNFKGSYIGVVRIGDIQRGEVIESDMKYIDKEIAELVPEQFKIHPGDILIAMSGATTGKIGVNKSNITYFMNQRVGKISPFEGINKKLLVYFLHYNQNNMLVTSNGSIIDNLSKEQYISFYYPLPPLAEQCVIVDRVNKLLSIIDELDKQVIARKGQAEDLMQAVLREAFEGGL